MAGPRGTPRTAREAGAGMLRWARQGVKGAIAASCEWSGLNALLLRAQKLFCHPYIRAINYHDIAPSSAARFESQLRHYARHFVPVGLGDLLALNGRCWPHSRPGLILCFDDGLRTHADVAGPLLDRYGFIGWFMVPVGFIDTPPSEQRRYALEHRILYGAEELPDARIAMTPEDVRQLDRRHVICSHTLNHQRLTASLTRRAMEEEIIGGKRRLEAHLGHEVRVFGWVGVGERVYSAEAARVVREAGFLAGFMSVSGRIRPGCDLFQLHRTNVEARFPPPLMHLALAGFFDILYLPSRLRVNRLTAVTSSTSSMSASGGGHSQVASTELGKVPAARGPAAEE